MSEESILQNEVIKNDKKASSSADISKVAKVQVSLCAELGRAKMPLRDVIEYDTGSIVMLDKTTSAPVDVFVDDILIARGKIVAIEDTYGIKIVEIIENNNKKEDN